MPRSPPPTLRKRIAPRRGSRNRIASIPPASGPGCSPRRRRFSSPRPERSRIEPPRRCPPSGKNPRTGRFRPRRYPAPKPERKEKGKRGALSLAQILQIRLGKHVFGNFFGLYPADVHLGLVPLFEFIDENPLHRDVTFFDQSVFQEIGGLHQGSRPGQGLFLEQEKIIPPHPIGF